MTTAGATPASVGTYVPPQTNEHTEVTMDLGSIQEVVAEVASSGDRGTNAGVDTDFDLKRFLERPVQVDSFQWAEGAVVNKGFAPLRQLIENATISRKLDGYSRIRCTTNIEIVMNASPYQYGGLMISGKPCGGGYVNYFSQPAGGALLNQGKSLANRLQQSSMLPNVIIEPSGNISARLTIPLIYPNEWIDLNDRGQDGATEFAVFLLYTSIAPLYTASAQVGTNITVNTFAWMSDIELMGPSQISVNGFSDVSSSVGAAMGMFSNVPVIGKYATSAQTAASAISSVARFFGYSHPVPTGTVNATIIDPTPSFASAHTSAHMDVLALDPQNQMTIGTGSLGYTSHDDLSIKNICARPAILTQGEWSPTHLTDKSLFSACVTPALVHSTLESGDGGNNYNSHLFSPLAYAAAPFKYWRGDVTFTIRFFPSKFHRGKIRVVYDPSGDPGITNPTLVMNKIVDISENPIVEFTAPYMSDLAWLQNDDPSLVAIPDSYTSHWEVLGSGAGALGYDTRFHNGVVRFEVMNNLTGPNNLASVPFIVYVHSNSMEFALPREYQQMISFADPVSVNGLEETGTPTQAGDVINRNDDKLYMSYMGEKVVSLRELLKRTVLYSTFAAEDLPTSYDAVRLSISMRRTPMPLVFNNAGFPYTVSTFTAAVPVYSNIVKMTPFDWISNAFIGYRGGFYWKFIPRDGDKTVSNMKITRLNEATSTHLSVQLKPTSEITGGYANASESAPAYISTMNGYYVSTPSRDKSGNGVSMTCPRVNPQAAASIPMYSQNKWYSTRTLTKVDSDYSLPNSDYLEDNMLVTFDYNPNTTVGSGSLVVDAYTSCADDMNLVFFCGLPPVFTSIPPKPPP